MERLVNNLTTCSHPSRIVNKATGVFMFVPCGHCLSCRNSYTKNWTSRLEAETRDSNSTLFFSLTYDNEHIPTILHDGNVFTSQCGNRVDSFIIDHFSYKNNYSDDRLWQRLYIRSSRTNPTNRPFEIGVNSKRDVQLFLKRLRRFIERDKNHLLDGISQTDRLLRYFVTSEYGPNTFRPHYHGLLWFKNRRVAQAVVDFYFHQAWKLGAKERQDIGFVIKDAPWYVSKYVTCNTSLPLILQNDYTKTFHLFSRRPSIGITSDSLDVMSRVFKESALEYTKTITSKVDGIYDIKLRYERRFLQYWFPDLLRSSCLSRDFLRNFICKSLQFFDSKSKCFSMISLDDVGLILPNLIDSVKRYYHLDKYYIPSSLDISEKPHFYSDVVEQFDNFEYMYGVPQSRLFIKRAIVYIARTNCTVDEYIDMWYRIRLLQFNHSLKAQYDYESYLRLCDNKSSIEKFLLLYPDFPLNLPSNRSALSLHFELVFTDLLKSFDITFDDFYNEYDKLIYDCDTCSTHHVHFSEFLVHENKIKESNMKFEKKRNINYKLYSND